MSKKTLSRLNRILAGARAESAEPVVEAGGTKLEEFAHFWVLVWRSFVRNRCPVRASALAYATLLALVPMLAVVVSVTSTFLKNEGEEQIDAFKPHAIDFSRSGQVQHRVQIDGWFRVGPLADEAGPHRVV